jgi:hypothetical protein
VVFSSGTKAARYVLSATHAPGGTPSLHVADSVACQGFSMPDDASCQMMDGPTPHLCWRYEGCLAVKFDFGTAQTMLNFLGSNTYDVSVQCGKDQVLLATGVTPSYRECGL